MRERVTVIERDRDCVGDGVPVRVREPEREVLRVAVGVRVRVSVGDAVAVAASGERLCVDGRVAIGDALDLGDADGVVVGASARRRTTLLSVSDTNRTPAGLTATETGKLSCASAATPPPLE